MIPTKQIGNPFAPAYAVAVAVDELGVPSGHGHRTERYVPAWGFVDALRAVLILDEWVWRDPINRDWSTHRGTSGIVLCLAEGQGDATQYLDYEGKGATSAEAGNAARIAAATALLAKHPTLADGIDLRQPAQAVAESAADNATWFNSLAIGDDWELRRVSENK